MTEQYERLTEREFDELQEGDMVRVALSGDRYPLAFIHDRRDLMVTYHLWTGDKGEAYYGDVYRPSQVDYELRERNLVS